MWIGGVDKQTVVCDPDLALPPYPNTFSPHPPCLFRPHHLSQNTPCMQGNCSTRIYPATASPLQNTDRLLRVIILLFIWDAAKRPVVWWPPNFPLSTLQLVWKCESRVSWPPAEFKDYRKLKGGQNTFKNCLFKMCLCCLVSMDATISWVVIEF